MVNNLNAINEKIIKVCRNMAVVLTFLIVVSTTIQVFTRFVLGAALVGTEEVARYSFVWASMLGAAICVSRSSHSAVSFIPDMLKGKVKDIHSIIVQILIMILAIIFIVQGYNMILVTLKQLSPTLKIPMWLVYLSIPLGGVAMVIASICNILNIIMKDNSRESEGGK